jgi:LacI family transcriptional regulator
MMRAVSLTRESGLSNLTLEDIAKEAGVSRSTVSRVMNNFPNISDGVRERVLEVIKETGYRPNAAARTLASQRSRTIGLVLPHSVSLLFTDPYYPHLLKGISQACNLHDHALSFFLASSKEDEKKIFGRVSNKGLLDGVLIQSGHHGNQQIIGQLIDVEMPQVVIGRPFRSDNVSFVDVDNVGGAYNAVSYLIRLGYERIATITGPLQSTVGLDRKEGYIKALSERGIKINQDLIMEGDFTEMGGYYAMQTLLNSQPDAVFAASDIMSIGAIRAIQESGLNVPSDIGVVGFDDFPITTFANTQLTTVHQPAIQLGFKAVELLIDLIENGIHPPRHIILSPKLMIRESCGSITGPAGGL